MENNRFKRESEESIKEQFENCELIERAKAIRALIAEKITRNSFSRDEVKEKYYQLGKARNISDGKEVTFYHGVFGKMYREGGLFAQAAPVLDKLFGNSLLAYSETDGKRGLHSSMVTNVVLYDETANVASASTTTGGRLDIDGIVDAKLKLFFESASNEEKKIRYSS